MKIKSFYGNSYVIGEDAEAERSVVCYHLIEELLSQLRSTANRKEIRVLDIGCGDMRFITKFKKIEGVKVFGTDISPLAKEIAKTRGVEFHKVNASEEKLPFRNGFFDICYMGDVIEHMFDPDFAISEVRRVLKPGGYLVLSTPNLACWCNRLLLLFGVQPIFSEVSTQRIFGRPGTKPVGHIRLFTLRSLKDFLSYNSFKTIKVKGSGFNSLPKIASIAGIFLNSIPSLSPILIVVAKVKK